MLLRMICVLEFLRRGLVTIMQLMLLSWKQFQAS